MFLSRKEIEDECQKFYEDLKNNQYNSNNVLQMIYESTRPINEKLYYIILDMDREIGTGLLKWSPKLLYWGLLPYEREVLQNICNKATEDTLLEVFYEAYDSYFKMFLDNNLKYDEIKDELRESAVSNEISRIREGLIQYYFSKKYFVDLDKNIRANRDKSLPKPSICSLLWEIVKNINFQIKNWYSNKSIKKSTYFFELSQEEFDELYGICIKGNNLGIVLYLGNNPENGIAHLNEEQINLIADIGKEALNRYLDILENKNNEYKKMETEFLNKMNKFGEKHDMSERELVNFADSALKMGYNLADIETQEELDDVYKKVYPEA